jgi:hypothetical protein
MVASHKMARGDSVNVAVCWLSCIRSKSPPNRLEPAPLTSEALVAYFKQLIMQTVHNLQLEIAGTDSLPEGEFCKATLIYFEITLPDSVVPLHLRTNGGSRNVH